MSRPTKNSKFSSTTKKDVLEFLKTLDYDLDQLYSNFNNMLRISKLQINTSIGSHLNLSGDTANSSSADGDVWFTGSDLRINIGGTVYTIDLTPV